MQANHNLRLEAVSVPLAPDCARRGILSTAAAVAARSIAAVSGNVVAQEPHSVVLTGYAISRLAIHWLAALQIGPEWTNKLRAH